MKNSDAIRIGMNIAGDAAYNSRCNSRKIGCVIADANGKWVATGYNDTVDPICLVGVCHKRMLGEKHGESTFCNAVHAEQMAAVQAQYKYQKAPELYTKPFTAVMTCGYPCTKCLAALKKSGVKYLILGEKDFYTDEDRLMWDELYSQEMEVMFYGDVSEKETAWDDEAKEEDEGHPRTGCYNPQSKECGECWERHALADAPTE